MSQKDSRHLHDYLLVLRERKSLIIACFLLVVAAGALLTYLQPRIFKAAAKVEVQVQPPNPLGSISEGTQPVRSVYFKESYFQTQFEKIRSRDLLSEVIRRHDLASFEPFSRMEDPVAGLRSRLDLSVVPNTDVLSIGATCRVPEVCVRVADAVAETFVDWNIERRVSTLLETKKSLEDSLAQEIEDFQDVAVTAIDQAKEKGTLTPELQKEQTQKRLQGFQEQIAEIRSEVERAEAALSQARRALSRPNAAISLTGITNSSIQEIYRRRNDLLSDLEGARTTFRETHPDIVALKKQIGQVTQELIGTLEGHLSSLKDQQSNLNRALTRETRMAMELARESEPLRGAEIRRDSTAQLLETLTGRLDQVSLLATRDLLINQAQIIEKAQLPTFPDSPQVKMNLLVSVLLGLMVGLGAAFFMDYLDVSVKTVEDVESGLDRNVLCTIPTRTKKNAPLVRESLQSLRTALIFADKAKPTNTVLFTSATPKEGKSTTVSDLARVMAAGGEKTILLDCDFRLPSISHNFQVPRDKGISTYVLDEEESWPSHIQKDVEPNLDVFPTGPLPPNPTDLLVSPRLTTLLSLLSREYDWVLLDAPPVTSMSDAVLLSDRVDGIVFVVKYDHVDRRTADRALTALESVGARILGVVLNAVDTRKPGYKDYFYGRYAYYGEAERTTEEEPVLQTVRGGRT